MDKPKLEIACFSIESALVAQSAGADRIEFCTDYSSGGVTPLFSDVIKLKKSLTIPMFVMIRPRNGDFNYSETEFELMKSQIIEFRNIGIDGFVFGILKNDFTIDEERNQELVLLARTLPCTFHRAFDQTLDVTQSILQIIGCGFKYLLTSGQARNAQLGSEVINNIVNLSGSNLQVIAGGGVRSDNIHQVMMDTCASWVHSSAILKNSTDADEHEINKIRRLIDLIS